MAGGAQRQYVPAHVPDQGVLRRLNDRYQEAIPIWQSWWYEADIDERMAAGDQVLWNQYFSYNYRINNYLQFNYIRRAENVLTGYQRRNRLTTVVVPQEPQDQQGADDWSGVVQWIMNSSDMYNTLSDAFGGAFRTGLNMLYLWMDYREDPENGDLLCDRVPYNGFIMDPYWRKADLSDCRWVMTRSWMGKEEALSLYPEAGEIVSNLEYATGNRDGKFAFLPEAYSFTQMKLIPVDEYWERSFRKQKRLLDFRTGELVDWRGTDDALDLLLQFRPDTKVLEATVPTVIRHIIIGGHVYSSMMRPYGSDRYPFIPVQWYYNWEIPQWSWRIQGAVRNIRDAQIEVNRRRNKMLDVLDSQINSGWIAKENALVNPEDGFLQGQGRMLFLRDEANMDDVRQIPPPTLSQGMFGMESMMTGSINDLLGISEELLGTDTSSVAGVLTALRQGAALTAQQGVFDKLNLSQKLLGQLIIDYVRENWDGWKVGRVLGRQPAPEFFTKDFAKYDLSVQEGLLTQTQRQMQFAQLLQLKEMGLNIPESELIKSATLQNKNELLKAIEEQQAQQQQALEQANQLAVAKESAQAQWLQSRSKAEEAIAFERQSKSITNIADAADRRAQSRREDAQAALDIAKAATEIEGMRQSQVASNASFLHSLQDRLAEKRIPSPFEAVPRVGEVSQARSFNQPSPPISKPEETQRAIPQETNA